MTDTRYGNTRVAKIKAAYDDLRSAIRAGDMEKAEAALDRYEQWADYVFSPVPQDRFIAAADALAEANKVLCNAAKPCFQDAGGFTNFGMAVGDKLPALWDATAGATIAEREYRAAREAITRGTPPAFATSA